MNQYVELCCTSNFSFLHGASHPEELAVAAARLELSGLCVTDRNSLAGVVRAHMAAKEAGLPFAPGCRIVFADATPDILIWPQNREGWGTLCELLTLGKRRTSKGECELYLKDLIGHGGNLLMAIMPNRLNKALKTCVATLAEHFASHLHLAITRNHGTSDQRRMARLARLAEEHSIPIIAIGDVLYHHPERRPLQDVLTCIREHQTLSAVGTRLNPNAERHLKPAHEMLRLFAGYEHAVIRTLALFQRIHFSLDELRYEYPEDPVFEELGNRPIPSQIALERLTRSGLKKRYPEGASQKVLNAIAHETGLIRKLNYAPYFLTVYDIVRFARSQGILCQGRGSAANSAVCYCLGITEVDPDKTDLLFERFISEERGEPPDIDVDFEHERREEVIQYIYAKYGREKAGLAATVITYRARSALREVGKVFGMSEDTITALNGTKWGSWSRQIDVDDARRAGLDPDDKHLKQMLDLASQIIGFPRHLSQHVGGFVIARETGCPRSFQSRMPPWQDRTVVEWDKDDLESLGMLKIDVLALGMLTCIRKSFDFLEAHYGRHETLSSLPDERHRYLRHDLPC